MQIVFLVIFSFLDSWGNLAHLRKWSNVSIISLSFKKIKEKESKAKKHAKD